ncbi:hypothetical protein EIP75_02150 [Aquabacterium soli]|uniref:Uncharacterized protein n=1 Tax=Aquabacterium soli TaxID=2493092 RepID=A0A3R8TWM5_9BURK|nr:hypothetical protein [Aquabacterium soli]RRS06406.1 hypothetical protein EIP75_02150 [Aquabacterium soli]
MTDELLTEAVLETARGDNLTTGASKSFSIPDVIYRKNDGTITNKISEIQITILSNGQAYISFNTHGYGYRTSNSYTLPVELSVSNTPVFRLDYQFSITCDDKHLTIMKSFDSSIFDAVNEAQIKPHNQKIKHC